jgi:hypothetical protein
MQLHYEIVETKTRLTNCLRFGAVLEEFELRDALEAVFSEKAMPTLDSTFAPQQHQISLMA